MRVINVSKMFGTRGGGETTDVQTFIKDFLYYEFA